ncbi:hypothetical protein F8388_003876 [Cannabis sativa]|uniref:RNase H type-1 domain-containing protein n=1 Tax=Cannabis sativa TaxID=3483 RepID=A0A7J6GR79_CANSA|nr:hypothetical protein F8388_003876 [Cannabis sativa]
MPQLAASKDQPHSSRHEVWKLLPCYKHDGNFDTGSMFDLFMMVLLVKLSKSEFEDVIRVMWALWENRNRKWNHLPVMNGVQLLDWVFTSYPASTRKSGEALNPLMTSPPISMRSVGVGFLWRGWEGNLIPAGMVYIPSQCSVVVAKAWVILEALKVLPGIETRPYEIQLDCKMVVEALKNPKNQLSAVGTILHQIKDVDDADKAVTVVPSADVNPSEAVGGSDKNVKDVEKPKGDESRLKVDDFFDGLSQLEIDDDQVVLAGLEAIGKIHVPAPNPDVFGEKSDALHTDEETEDTVSDTPLLDKRKRAPALKSPFVDFGSADVGSTPMELMSSGSQSAGDDRDFKMVTYVKGLYALNDAFVDPVSTEIEAKFDAWIGRGQPESMHAKFCILHPCHLTNLTYCPTHSLTDE